MSKVFIPAGYHSCLSLYDTQKAISLIKRVFEDTLCGNLNLSRVSAPLFVEDKGTHTGRSCNRNSKKPCPHGY